MAEREALGEAKVNDSVDRPAGDPIEAEVEHPVHDAVDTDPFAAQQADPADPPAADGQFDYLLGETEAPAGGPEWPEPGAHEPGAHEPITPDTVAPDPDGRVFDAFNANTWNFKPAPVPWYRARQSVLAMVAVSVAVIALVVSVVLLAFRGPAEERDVPTTDTSAAPTTASTAPDTIGDAPAPLPPPPPPPPPTASQIQRAPVYAPPASPTKKPEQNVTRKPMSVSPQKPSGRQ